MYSQKKVFYIAGRYIGLSVSGRVQCLQRPNHSGGVGGLGLNTIVQQLFSLKRITKIDFYKNKLTIFKILIFRLGLNTIAQQFFSLK